MASTTIATAALDASRLEAFGAHLTSLYRGGLLTFMIDLGHRTGLFSAMAAAPGTSSEIAARSGLTERYVREWLGAMVTGGVVGYDATTGGYHLAPEHAVLLAGPEGMAPLAQTVTPLAKHVHQVARAFREGGGVPPGDYRPEFVDALDAILRMEHDRYLVDGLLPLVPGLRERLTAGGRVADAGCGTGHAAVLLGRAFPASTFVGYDLDGAALARARAEVAGAQLGNVSFELGDATCLRDEPTFDAVLVLTMLHDCARPEALLERVHGALVPGGHLLMKEPIGRANLEESVADPLAAIQYSISTLYCLPISLAHGGPGIGSVFPEHRVREMLVRAGFAHVSVHPAPGNPGDAIYVTGRSSS